MLIHDEFLVRGAVLHADFLAFQQVNGGVFTFLTDEQRRVVVVRGGEQNLLLTLRCDVHTGHYGVDTAELQAWDQAVERLVAEGTGRVDLFTQGICQVHVEANNLVVRINGFKRRVGRFSGETDGLGCGSGKADASKQRGNQYFFHYNFPNTSV